MLFPIDKLEPGLVLSSDVLNSSNVALLVEGTRLTAQHLHLLKVRGILAVEIQQGGIDGETPSVSSEKPNAFVAAAELHVDRRLKHVSINQPSLALIREMAVRRKAEALARRQRENPEPDHEV